MEKRRHPRSRQFKGTRVAWRSHGEYLAGAISDLSLGGAFIHTPKPAPVGTAISVLLDAPSSAIRAQAVVHRSIPGEGMGIEFQSLSNDAQARLASLLRATDEPQSPAKTQRIAPKSRESAVAAPPAATPPPKPVEKPKASPAASPIAAGISVGPSGGAVRRAHMRHKIAAPIELIEAESGKRVKARLSDLGRAGCYVNFDSPFPVGTALELVIHQGPKSFHAQARVVYAMPGKGMGLSFTLVEPEQYQILDKWLAAYMETSWQASNRRRSQRVMLNVPVQVVGNNTVGTQFEEETETISVSAHGAVLLLSPVVTKGQLLTLTNLRTKAALECVVAYLGQNQGNRREVGISFTLPNRMFWQVVFPPWDWSSRHPDARGT